MTPWVRSCAQGKAPSALAKALPHRKYAVRLLTIRDLEIFEALTKRVRVLSVQQIARTWWADSHRVAQNRLRGLATDGLLQIQSLPAHPELCLEEPVSVWTPGAPNPDFGSISYQLQSRWREHPVLTACVSASKLAAKRFGGYGGRPPRSVERTHDIHMARVFLLYRERHPELVREWVFEEQVKTERRQALRNAELDYSSVEQKLPDAFLRSASGTKVIEFGGAYGKDKLLGLHAYCKEHSFPYEIW